MRTQGILAVLSSAIIGSVVASDAPIVTGNPTDVEYTATLPETPFFKNAAIEGNVKGSITATVPADGKGVTYTVKFENLPKEGGPFIYHVHAKAAVDGNCTSTGAHLDPYLRGEDTPCDTPNPASCQVGDLSGKHGKIASDPFTAEYTDPYSSLQVGSPSYFGDLSFVLHYANKTRLTCANFVKVETPVPTGNHTATPTPTGTGGLPTTTGNPNPTTPPISGAVSAYGLSSSLMAGALALLLVL